MTAPESLFLPGDELRRGDVVRVGETTQLALIDRVEPEAERHLIYCTRGTFRLARGSVAEVVIRRVK